MMLFDRYSAKKILEKDLPEQIDFGRFAITEGVKTCIEITYSNFQTQKIIRQALLLEENKSLQEIFIDINIDINKDNKGVFNVIPLIRRIKNKLGLNDFEELLCDKIFHLEEIFRTPHYLLEREIEKVNVSRAKRIPSKSYQYLASHTEDWIHKSIVSFKPSRILNEELELNFDVYENQLTLAFIERCLVYLNSRIKEIQDIRSFLTEYEKLLKNRDDQKGWYKKIERNLSLIGAVYEDDHYHGQISASSTLTQTEESLNKINKRLLLLRKSELFSIVNKRTIQSVTLRNTNVLVNHKHYRYVKSLWIELNKIKPEKTENEKLQYDQDIFKGVVSYANCLLAYCLQENLDFDLSGNYTSFSCTHLRYPLVQFSKDTRELFELKIGKQTLKFIIIANEPTINGNLIDLLVKQNAYLLYFAESSSAINSRVININPLDADSVERVGALLRKYLLKEYLAEINKTYIFKQMLKEYIHHVQSNHLEFSTKDYSYRFILYPHAPLKVEDVICNIEGDENYKSLTSRPHKENIIKEVTYLITEINRNAELLKNEFLKCFNCGELINAHTIPNLNYIKCPSCHALIDSSVSDNVILKIDDSKTACLSKNEFGMDYLKFKLSEL